MGHTGCRPRMLRRASSPVLLAGLAAAPFVLGSYPVSLLSAALAFGVLAMSVNLLTGLTGLATLGQAAYFGVGGYATVLVADTLTTVGPVQVLIAALLAGTAAAVTAPVLTKARGTTFLMITLAIGELVEVGITRWSSLTGGSEGTSAAPIRPFFGLPELRLDGLVYYYTLALFLVLFLVVSILARSPYGLALRGIRDNEARMRALGYPVTAYVFSVHCIAGALAGAGGALWVGVHDYISPADAGFGTSALALLAVAIGRGSVRDACLGAVLVVLTRDYLGGLLGGHSQLLLGIVFVLTAYLLPRGFAWLRAGTAREGP